VLATFPAGIAAYAVAVLALGAGAASLVLATAATVAFSLAFYRSSRGLYFALDYLIDPVADAAPPSTDRGGGDRRGGPRRGPRERPDADHRCGAAPAPDASGATSASSAPPCPAPAPDDAATTR